MPYTLRPPTIVYLSLLMAIIGVFEMITSLYFTQVYSIETIYIYIALILDVSFLGAGLLLLSMERRFAVFAILLLIADIAGRVSLVATHIYPFNTLAPGIAMILGTLLAGAFAIYIWTKLDIFV